jgi:hypothetical protein
MNPYILINLLLRALPRATRATVFFGLAAALVLLLPTQVVAGSSSKSSSAKPSASKSSAAKTSSSKATSSKSSSNKQASSKSTSYSRSNDRDDDKDHHSSDDDRGEDDHNEHSGYGDNWHDNDGDDDCGTGGGVVLIPVTIFNTTGTQLIINLGDSGTLTANLVAGSGPVTFQWMKRNSLGAFSAIPGATGLTLTLSGTTEADTGEYWIIATNSLGSVASASTQVVIASALEVLNTSGSEVVIAPGETGALTAQLIAGTQPVTYQWWRRDSTGAVTAVAGASALTLNIVNATELNAGQYWIVATNSTGSVASSETQVIVAFSSE